MLGLIDESPDIVTAVVAACDPGKVSSPARPALPTPSALMDELRFAMLERARRASRSHAPDPALRAVSARWPALVDDCAWASETEDPAFRSEAAAACAASRPGDASLLLSLARDTSWLVRARVAVALREHPEAPGAAAVLPLLARDPHPTVRHAARSVQSSSSGPALS